MVTQEMLSRAILGEGRFQPGSFPDLNTDYTRGITVCPITRSDKLCYACIVPVLLAGDSPLRPGESVRVRIRPPHDKPSYDIDSGWHEFIVRPVGVDRALSSEAATPAQDH